MSRPASAGNPKSLLLFGGDVHHCWISQIELPDDAPPTKTRIWQMVCSGLRKELQLKERVALQLGHTRFAAAVGRALVSTTRTAMPRLRWRSVTRPHFRNQVGTLDIARGEVGVRVEEVSGSWRKPRLLTVIEHKLL